MGKKKTKIKLDAVEIYILSKGLGAMTHDHPEMYQLNINKGKY